MVNYIKLAKASIIRITYESSKHVCLGLRAYKYYKS